MKYCYVAFPKMAEQAKRWKEEFLEINLYPQKKNEQGNDKPIEDYRNEKMVYQNWWLNFLEDKMSVEVNRALRQLHADGNPDVLYIVVFPEACFTDVEPQDRKHEEKYFFRNEEREEEEDEEIISEYKNPFYMENAGKFFEHNITFKHLAVDNVMLCPGTIWWKDRTESEEDVLYNTASVFYQGECRFLWDKQLLSNKDGAGRYLQEVTKGKKIKKWCSPRIKHMSDNGVGEAILQEIKNLDNFNEHMSAYLKQNKPPFLSRFTSQYNRNSNNRYCFAFQEQEYTMTLDICMDYMNGLGKIMVPDSPDFHVIVSNAAMPDPNLFYPGSTALFCDSEQDSYLYEWNQEEKFEARPMKHIGSFFYLQREKNHQERSG